MFKFGERSLRCLATVHEDLRWLCNEAIKISPLDFGVYEGIRTLKKQEKYVVDGKSMACNSRHLHGMAVDIVVLVDGDADWSVDAYKKILPAFQRASVEIDVPFEWGGDFYNFVDAPHFQLPHDRYPDFEQITILANEMEKRLKRC